MLKNELDSIKKHIGYVDKPQPPIGSVVYENGYDVSYNTLKKKYA